MQYGIKFYTHRQTIEFMYYLDSICICKQQFFLDPIKLFSMTISYFYDEKRLRNYKFHKLNVFFNVIVK